MAQGVSLLVTLVGGCVAAGGVAVVTLSQPAGPEQKEPVGQAQRPVATQAVSSPSHSATTSATVTTAPPTVQRPPSPTANPPRTTGSAGDATPPSSSTTRTSKAAQVNPAPASGSTAYQVTGVVDGDTLKVRVNGTTERVRVIGIDTPELRGSECYAQQAASKMQSLAQSRSVFLEADDSQADRDRYGRLLRHVRLTDGRLAAEVLIAGGFGEEYTYNTP